MTAKGFYNRGERSDSTLTAKERGNLKPRSRVRVGVSVEGQLPSGNFGRQEDSNQTDLTGFSLKAGQGEQMSPEVSWRFRNLVKYPGWGILAKLT